MRVALAWRASGSLRGCAAQVGHDGPGSLVGRFGAFGSVLRRSGGPQGWGIAMRRQVVRSTVIRGVRPLAVASAAALAAALALVPSQATAGSGKPSASASEEATHPDTHGVMQGQAHYTVNRGAQQIRSQTCTLTAEGGVPLTIPARSRQTSPTWRPPWRTGRRTLMPLSASSGDGGSLASALDTVST